MDVYRGLLLFDGGEFRAVVIYDEDFANDELCNAYVKMLTKNDDRWQTVFDTGKGVFSEEELVHKLTGAEMVFSMNYILQSKSEADNGR